MDRPIPAFYCCYLLRSTVQHAALYVGSTPNPARRLKQHNGIATGGAKRTSRDKLRPWEMVCLVTGFPSKIAALQFEWAWQHTHLTRHIPAEERITKVVTRTWVSPETGRGRKKNVKPRMPLIDRISNLHVMLRVQSFERWPLGVRFFNADVWKTWKKWDEKTQDKIRHGITVTLERPAKSSATPTEIQAIDATYRPMREQLERSRDAFAGKMRHECSTCEEPIRPGKELAVLCPTTDCDAVSHLQCLSQEFLRQEGQVDAIVPTSGRCKSCGKSHQWADIMKDLSLRMRGQSVLDAVFKSRKKKLEAASVSAAEENLLSGIDDDEEGMVVDMPGLIVPRRKSAVQAAEEETSWIFEAESMKHVGVQKATAMEVNDDDWQPPPDFDDDDDLALEGIPALSSDWDYAEVVE